MKKTTLDELKQWLAEPRESSGLEFKEAKTQYDNTKLFRYCVAIANEGGGKLILGVSDKPPRTIVGSNAFENPTKMQKKILDKLHFRVEVEEFMHEDGRVVIFHIPSRPNGTAYNFEGSYLMRSTEDTVPMSEDRLREIFDEGKPDWTSLIATDSCSDTDVVLLLDTQSFFDMLGLPYPSERAGVLARFESERLIMKSGESWAITNLGAILFAKKLNDFEGLYRKAPRLIVYDGTNKLKTRYDKVGTRGYAIAFEGLVDSINSQIPTNVVIEKALRKEVKMFPEIAIRELVANALIHQDYNETGTSVVVEIYSDRLEITNPGKPYIPVERFIDGYQSRNEKLADLMRRLKVCEETGSGIDKVIDAAEIFQLPAPDFRATEHRTIATIFAHKEFKDMDRKDRIRAAHQHCVLRHVMNERMTNNSLRERFNLPKNKSETISRIIRETTKAKLIKLSDPEIKSLRNRSYVPYWA